VHYLKSLYLKINIFLCYFIIYSFFGWCVETAFASAKSGTFVKSGLMYGPFSPIYGFGAIILIITLKPFKNNLALFFLSTMIITSALEYSTSFILETIFKIKIWDYSNELLNLNGRICVKFSIFWGVFAIIIIYLVHPHIQNFVLKLPGTCIKAASLFIILYFFIDLTVLASSLHGIKQKFQGINIIYTCLRNQVLQFLKASTIENINFLLKIKG
jgi:uncharacterized membrane protein